MPPTTILPLPAISPEVLAFAAERGVERYLPNVVAAVRRLFPDSRIDVLVEDDKELSYNRQIVFEVDPNGRTAEEQSAASWRWADEIYRHCPATHVHVFCLMQ